MEDTGELKKRKTGKYKRYFEPEGDTEKIPRTTKHRWNRSKQQTEVFLTGEDGSSDDSISSHHSDWHQDAQGSDNSPSDDGLRATPLTNHCGDDHPFNESLDEDELTLRNQHHPPLDGIHAVKSSDIGMSLEVDESELHRPTPSNNVWPHHSALEEVMHFEDFHHEGVSEENLDGDGDQSSSDDDDGAGSQYGSSDSEEDEPIFETVETLNEPLCDGIATTRAEALLMVMSFVMRYALSTAALVGLLQLINQLFGRPVLVATKYLLGKIFHNKCLKFSFHFYCQYCYTLVSTFQVDERPESVPCPHCERACMVKSLSAANFFVTTDLKSQVKCLLEMPELAANLSYRNEREKSEDDGIEDIFDGEAYKKLCEPGQPLSNPNNFSYSFNSDGMPVFQSSKYSLWPIYLMVNELPPRLRNKHLILAGVWFGKFEPKMNLFLKEFVTEAEKLRTDGVVWNNNGQEVKSRLYGVSCVVDAPARAAMQNTVQFNGYMGCGLCYHPGVNVEGTVKYPMNVGEYNERSDDEMLQDMRQALEEGRIVRGVKGPSPLINIGGFQIIWGFPVDFMHCVLLGVVRQLSDLWFNSPAHSPFYIGTPNNLTRLDQVIKQVQFPSFISRTQRPVSERKFWKASEWYNWLLFLALPCLTEILPDEYLNHLCMLVESIFLLLKKSVSKLDCNKADFLLYAFVAKMQILYGERSMTFNVHSLTHLARGVQSWGPLWTHSCFPFEAANGKIKALLHGNRGIIMQTLHKFLIIRSLPAFKLAYQISPQTDVFCDDILFSKKLSPSRISDEVELFGIGRIEQLAPEEVAAVEASGIDLNDPVLTFHRMKIGGFMYHTVKYRKSRTRNNRVFATKNGCIGELQRIMCTGNNECAILFKKIEVAAVDAFVGDGMEIPVGHIKVSTNITNNIYVTAAQDIAQSCIFFTVGNRSYVCFPPNCIAI